MNLTGYFLSSITTHMKSRMDGRGGVQIQGVGFQKAMMASHFNSLLKVAIVFLQLSH